MNHPTGFRSPGPDRMTIARGGDFQGRPRSFFCLFFLGSVSFSLWFSALFRSPDPFSKDSMSQAQVTHLASRFDDAPR